MRFLMYDRAQVSLEPQQPPKLEYFAPTAPGRPFKQWRGYWFVDALAMPQDPELKGWWLRRVFYYLVVVAAFIIMAFSVIPNEMNFGMLHKPIPADFVPLVETECAPIVKAMKEFQRDHGRMPTDERELAPDYLPDVKFPGSARQGTFEYYTKWNHMISYNFTPGGEGWSIIGPFANGTIPAPLVTISPSTSPATRAAQ
jgi:hypothetical protein